MKNVRASRDFPHMLLKFLICRPKLKNCFRKRKIFRAPRGFSIEFRLISGTKRKFPTFALPTKKLMLNSMLFSAMLLLLKIDVLTLEIFAPPSEKVGSICPPTFGHLRGVAPHLSNIYPNVNKQWCYATFVKKITQQTKITHSIYKGAVF